MKYTYDDWGNVTLFEQDKDGAVVSMGNQYSVAYAYAKAGSGGSGRHAVRCTGMTLPSGASLTYEYLGVSSARLDDALSRVSRIKHGSTIVASYRYTGLGMVVEEALNQPNVTTLTHGSSMGDYPYLDNFNRVTDSRWQAGNASNVPFYGVALTYDRNGNITTAEDHIHTVGTAGSGNGLFDAVYTIDNLDRVTEAREGHLSGGAIANTSDTRRDQQWTLDQVGNWKNEKLDLSGGAVNWTGAGEYQQDGTFSLANEWTKREQDTNATAGYENTYTMAYDGVGNMTDDGQAYKYVYDVFNRLVEVKTKAAISATVAKYRYNGLGYRLSWQYDNDGVAGFNGANDKKFYFVYDTKWRMAATYRESDTDPKEEFTYHNAGMDGSGGSSYIDKVVMRDKDANTAWATAAADGVLEERRYHCQNWRGDVSAVLTDTGKMVEWVKYSAYGVPFGIPAGDTNSKGFYLPADNAFMATGQTYDIRRDVNMDGTVTGADATHAASIAGGFQTLGRGVLSSTSIGNRKGYAGYENDGSIGDQYHVRYRVYRPTLGRWLQRDPVGYIDGMGLYEYVQSNSLILSDPEGLGQIIWRPWIKPVPKWIPTIPWSPIPPFLVVPNIVTPMIPIPMTPVVLPSIPTGHCFVSINTPFGTTTIGWAPGGFHINDPSDLKAPPLGPDGKTPPPVLDDLGLGLAVACCALNPGCNGFDSSAPYSYPDNSCQTFCACVQKVYDEGCKCLAQQ